MNARSFNVKGYSGKSSRGPAVYGRSAAGSNELEDILSRYMQGGPAERFNLYMQHRSLRREFASMDREITVF